MNTKLAILCATSLIVASCSSNDPFSAFKPAGGEKRQAVENDFHFNGYTNHWTSVFTDQFRYGNLYKVNTANVAKNIAQFKLNLADELGLSGLQMQEGFMNGLMTSEYSVLKFPSASEIKDSASGNLLVLVDKDSDEGKALSKKAPCVEAVGSYQRNSRSYDAIDAFILKKGKKNIYAVVGDKDRILSLEAMIATAKDVLSRYDMKRGWFGVSTNTQSVTCTPCNQLEAISRGMNEGNSWFVFNGLYEYISQAKTPGYLEEIGTPAVIDFGSNPIYGTEDFSNLQVQLMFGQKEWEEFKAQYGGYESGGMPSEIVEEDNSCDFYFVNPGIAKQVNSGKKPFAVSTGELINGFSDCMVLFNRKGEEFNKAKMWECIMDRREVAICDGCCLMGDDQYRQTLQLLVLDRIFIEEYFGDRVNITATLSDDEIHVFATNNYNNSVTCDFSTVLPAQLSLAGKAQQRVSIAAGETKEIVFGLNPSVAAMGRRNAALVKADWGASSKSVLVDCELPPAVSAHQLLYGAAGDCGFPVSIHNITAEPDVNVKLVVFEKSNPEKVVLETEQTVSARKGSYATTEFKLDLPEGAYTVKTSAMGAEAETQLGISSGKGNVTLKEVDLNNDGLNEYVMENDLVRVTLIRTGARAIELYVKDRDDNVFFKLWPDNPIDVNRAYRDRNYWPFGGFEDFLGQASAETHKVFDVEVVKDGGSYAQVKMTGDLYGNIVEKTYTLYGDSPLLDVRFALDFINPEMDILGPQPILALGKEHWTEDLFYVPTEDGLKLNVMKPEKYFGSMFYPTEGWHSGYDTKQDITFIGAFPVNRPMYLHMWMNHPANGDTHYYYAEFQPWITIEQGVTSYFSYYMWASGGKWEDNLKTMRGLNLITSK